MPSLSNRSLSNLDTCDKRIRVVVLAVVNTFDCTVLEGHRDKQRQDDLFHAGKSKLMYPNGKHNLSPSLAVDLIPYPIDWNDRERMTLFAGYFLGIANSIYQQTNWRWGGDWNRNWKVKDNIFDDLVHFEIYGE